MRSETMGQGPMSPYSKVGYVSTGTHWAPVLPLHLTASYVPARRDGVGLVAGPPAADGGQGGAA